MLLRTGQYAAAITTAACLLLMPRSCSCGEPPDVASGTVSAGVRQTRLFLETQREEYEEAVERARLWLDRLKVDPIELRKRGIKGKKKLAEILDTYYRLYSAADDSTRPGILARVRDLCAVTGGTNYHDMLSLNALEFKQDATSYLRVAYLMERFGLDTSLYRREIQRVHPRLNEHMPTRGVDQRMAFHWYYRHFKLEEPFELQSAYQSGLIASRRRPAWFKNSIMQAYNLTHEVFVPYEFGEKLNADFFPPADKAYLRDTLAELIPWAIERREVDLGAEFILCAAYLDFTDMQPYRDGLRFILGAQNKNGSWGDYERHRPAMGDSVEQGLYLHTTMVALDALVIAFDFKEP